MPTESHAYLLLLEGGMKKQRKEEGVRNKGTMDITRQFQWKWKVTYSNAS